MMTRPDRLDARYCDRRKIDTTILLGMEELGREVERSVARDRLDALRLEDAAMANRLRESIL